jgi:low affinity Fe/Cu permease
LAQNSRVFVRDWVGGLAESGAKTMALTRRTHAHGHGSRLSKKFSGFAQTVATFSGHPYVFFAAVIIIVTWIVTGPIFGFSDTWQLVVNTGTTIITFLMVFLIQNTQNRDMMAVQVKLSELVLAMKGAENKFASIEDLSDDELGELHEECRKRAEMTWNDLEKRRHRGKREKPAR